MFEGFSKIHTIFLLILHKFCKWFIFRFHSYESRPRSLLSPPDPSLHGCQELRSGRWSEHCQQNLQIPHQPEILRESQSAGRCQVSMWTFLFSEVFLILLITTNDLLNVFFVLSFKEKSTHPLFLYNSLIRKLPLMSILDNTSDFPHDLLRDRTPSKKNSRIWFFQCDDLYITFIVDLNKIFS